IDEIDPRSFSIYPNPFTDHTTAVVKYMTASSDKAEMMSLAREVAPYRSRVYAIAPVAIRTPINTGVWSTPAALESLMHLIPYKRIGEPEDIGRCAAWLLSDHADYLTGTTLFVDGGMTLFPGFATGG
ncbi:MAG: SDR family oxidoreductase, partial [Chlamydiia bacterium]